MSHFLPPARRPRAVRPAFLDPRDAPIGKTLALPQHHVGLQPVDQIFARRQRFGAMAAARQHRSEEHTSELQSLMRISYAVFCLKKKKHICTIREDVL